MFKPPSLRSPEKFASSVDTFEEAGGEILLYSVEDRQPLEWVCGTTDKGEPLHPPISLNGTADAETIAKARAEVLSLIPSCRAYRPNELHGTRRDDYIRKQREDWP